MSATTRAPGATVRSAAQVRAYHPTIHSSHEERRVTPKRPVAAQHRIEALEREVEAARSTWPTATVETPAWVAGLASLGVLALVFVGFVLLALCCDSSWHFGVHGTDHTSRA